MHYCTARNNCSLINCIFPQTQTSTSVLLTGVHVWNTFGSHFCQKTLFTSRFPISESCERDDASAAPRQRMKINGTLNRAVANPSTLLSDSHYHIQLSFCQKLPRRTLCIRSLHDKLVALMFNTRFGTQIYISRPYSVFLPYLGG